MNAIVQAKSSGTTSPSKPEFQSSGMPATAKAESAVAVLRHGKDPHGAVLLPPIWRPIAIGGARFAARGVIWLRPEQWERSPENASGSRTRASALPIRRPRWRTPLRHARSARRLRRVRRAPRRGVAGRRLTTCLKPQDCSRVQGGYFAQATCLKVLVCSRGQARYIPQAASAVSDSVQLSDSAIKLDPKCAAKGMNSPGNYPLTHWLN